MIRRIGAVPLALAALVLVAAAVLYAVAASGSTHVTGSPRGGAAAEAQYRWDGGTILLQRTAGNRGCTVTPDGGEPRELDGLASQRSRYDNVTELTPWFSGAATISCRGSVTIWSGAVVGLKKLTSGQPFLMVAALLVAVPVLVGIARSGRRARR